MATKTEQERLLEEERSQRDRKEKETKERGTTKGYSGVAGEEGYPAPEYISKLPEGAVISPVGVTRPQVAGIMDPYRKERSEDPQLAGKVLIKGKTHHGFSYERIVEIIQPRTEKGMFQVFKSHFPDAVEEDFSCEAVSDERAAELENEWREEMRGKEKQKRDEAEKARESGSKKGASGKEQEDEEEDLESLTVAELKERADAEEIETRSDFVKADYIKALKKGRNG